MNINHIRGCIKRSRYEISFHAQKERATEDITLEDIEHVLSHGKIIEKYPDDPRGNSCLVLGFAHRGPIHVVCVLLSNGWVRVVTVYIPQLPKWISPEQRRK